MELLQRVELFSGLTLGELTAVAGLMRRRRYAAGMIVFLQGEPVEAVYFVETGSVKASVTGADGQERIINVVGAGGFLPHVGFLDGGPSPATAQALEATTLWVIQQRPFYDLLSANPALAVRMVAILTGYIRRLQLRLQELASHSVPVRLARLLMRLGEQHGEQDETGAVRIAVPLSHQDIAGMIGTTRETVSRILSELRREGIVSGRAGHIVLPDPARLARWCQAR